MTKYTGIARKVDELGRIVLPVEMRRALALAAGDEVDVTLENRSIVLRKIEARCTFCGSAARLREFRGRQVCSFCVTELSATDNS